MTGHAGSGEEVAGHVDEALVAEASAALIAHETMRFAAERARVRSEA